MTTTTSVLEVENLGRGWSLADVSPELDYASWRDAVLSMMAAVEPTYFAWRGQDGMRRAAVLRRGVLSPLPAQTTEALARAILTDALGERMGPLADEPVAAFAADVLDALPDDEFELRRGEVATWLVRRSFGTLTATEPVTGQMADEEIAA